MIDPAYVRIANEYAAKIRSGELAPRTQLPTYAEIAAEYGVSDIIVRKALRLLEEQALVRPQRRRGVFVADSPGLVRVSPERQLEGPESTLNSESEEKTTIEKTENKIIADEDLAEEFGVEVGATMLYTTTRGFEGSRPVFVSDTVVPFGQVGIKGSKVLQETLADRVPTPSHADALEIPSGQIVKTVHQKYWDENNRLIMRSDITYRRDRYDAFTFTMQL